jgi:hypothetical protein
MAPQDSARPRIATRPYAWLGREGSNLRMAESNPANLLGLSIAFTNLLRNLLPYRSIV